VRQLPGASLEQFDSIVTTEPVSIHAGEGPGQLGTGSNRPQCLRCLRIEHTFESTGAL
jgi:hypothetical protein